MIYLVINRKSFDDVDEREYLINKSSKQPLYVELMKAIDLNEFETFKDISMNTDVDYQTNLEQPLESQMTNVRWVMIEDKIYDITTLRHPKGNYILREIRNSDITREIHGLKHWRFENRKDKYVKFSKHRHQLSTLNFLKQYCISEMVLNQLIFSNQVTKYKSDSSSGINLFNKESLGPSSLRKQKQNYWKLFSFVNLSKDYQIQYLCKLEQNYLLNLSEYWIKNFGRYFLIKNQRNQMNYFYITQSLSGKYIALKNQWYDSFPIDQQNIFRDFINFSKNPIEQVYQRLENSYTQQQKILLEQGEEIKDLLVPVVIYSSKQNNILFNSDKLTLIGPLGLGNWVEPHSSKHILLAIKDEGILPFTDMLEFFSQRSLMEFTQLKQNHFLFTNEYLFSYANQPEIIIYWEITNSFIEIAQRLGLEQLELISMIQYLEEKQHEDKTNKVSKIFQKIYISNQKIVSKQSRIRVVSLKAQDYDNLINIIDESVQNQIDRIVVSGDVDFTKRILLNATLPSQEIKLL